ncbi:MAG TPA: NPCBM/NEW2 domain-containing protein [Kiritimatiellia bacterium]|nr:NPCBM/NEW2 domain-containing protein [Kiritimatiellia bacterium]HOR96764.1 NPCBM/NEW2 domain-containing protein [Kiritimatiellia bacterium]
MRFSLSHRPATYIPLLCMLTLSSARLLGADETILWLDTLDLSSMTSAGEPPQAGRTVGGNPFKIARKRFERGVGTHAESWLSLEARGGALAFQAWVGVDDEELIRGKGSVIFRVYADGRRVADSGIRRAREPAFLLRADLTGAQVVTLHVSDAGDGDARDHADWCEAFFTLKQGASLTPLPAPPTEQMGILTPASPLEPLLRGPRRFGVRPGSPLLFRIPATGEKPIRFAARDLPPGVSLDSTTGLLTGAVTRPGSYAITLAAENARGRTERIWHLEVGERLALTPPLGWNAWNVFAHTVSDAKIRQAAEAMVSSGLADHGWAYINIDDYWQTCPGEREDTALMGPGRDPSGRILPNRRFPDMRGLVQYVHGLGLKIGLYSSPGPLTCGGCVGSLGHEARDAQTIAEWGFDYLKYDWCSYAQIAADDTLAEQMRPFLLMGAALRKQPRDILFSLCQYGIGHVSAWGDKAGGHCWRTTQDITDTWSSISQIAEAQVGLELFAGPGNWNDPDMLVVGTVGWGSPRPSRLTPNEQYTHVSLWCLLSAPLLIGCDLTRLDAFTLNLLTNDEVLEVNQDPLGRQAVRVQRTDAQEVWAKPLEDGSLAAGIINRGMLTAPVTLDLTTLGLTGPQQLRDLWRQRDLGTFADASFKTTLPGHGVLLLRITPIKQ